MLGELVLGIFLTAPAWGVGELIAKWWLFRRWLAAERGWHRWQNWLAEEKRWEELRAKQQYQLYQQRLAGGVDQYGQRYEIVKRQLRDGMISPAEARAFSVEDYGVHVWQHEDPIRFIKPRRIGEP